MTGTTHVVVIGGGYAGVLAANRLTQRGDVAVTLINSRPDFVERIRLHQLVGGSDDALIDYQELLAGRVRLTVDTATRIDRTSRTVSLASGDSIRYDHLIYAVGSRSVDPGVPGAAEFAHPLATLEDAQRLRSVIEGAEATTAVTVIGAGPLGIEIAAELAEAGRRVTLLDSGVLGPYLHPAGRRSVARALTRLGVRVQTGAGARVTAVTAQAVLLAGGRELASGITIWAGGFSAPDLARDSGLSTDQHGRLITDETLTSIDDELIVAAGDAAAPSDRPFRMSCQAAIQLGPQAADTVLSRIAGEQPAPLAVGMGAECISLGRRYGIYQFARTDDTAVRWYIGGRAGAVVKELVCAGIPKMLSWEARRPDTINFPRFFTDHRRSRQLAAAGTEPAVTVT